MLAARAPQAKKGHGGKHTRPKKWSGARRPVGPATTALSRYMIQTPSFRKMSRELTLANGNYNMQTRYGKSCISSYSKK